MFFACIECTIATWKSFLSSKEESTQQQQHVEENVQQSKTLAMAEELI